MRIRTGENPTLKNYTMSFLNTIKQRFGLNYKTLFWLYLIVTIGATIPKIILGKYNNYLIFVDSFELLKNHQNPFLLHPDLYYDLYRYSPSFAILVAPFSFLPVSIGVLLWNLINAFALFFAVKYIFKNDERKGSLIILTILPELVTSIQNIQINALVTAIMLFSYACFIFKKEAWAGLLCVLNLFIKIYGFAAVALFFMAKRKSAFIKSSTLSFIGFIALPLLFITIPELAGLYKSEFSSIGAYSVPLSFMGILRSWFGITFNDLIIQIPALLIVCAPIVPGIFKSEEIKLKLQGLLICSVLTFLCIFNQMAESATYIVAITGAVIWYFTAPSSKLNTVLLIFLIIFSEFGPTDLIPRFIRHDFLEPYRIKALPVVLIWVKIQWDSWKIILENKTKSLSESL